MGTVVQSVASSAAAGPTTVCVMPSNVTAGNLLVIMTGHIGGNECNAGSGNAVYTDTRGLTYTALVAGQNVNGAQSNCCIITAPITSSGPQTITRTIASSNYPNSMWAVEVSGVSSLATAAVNASFADFVLTINTGNVTSAAADLLILACAAHNTTPPFDSVSPTGSASNFPANGVQAGMIQFAAAGTYSATFGKPGASGRFSACIALLSYTPAAQQYGIAGTAAAVGTGQKGCAI